MPSDQPDPAISPRTRAKARHILDHYYIGPARDPKNSFIWRGASSTSSAFRDGGVSTMIRSHSSRVS